MASNCYPARSKSSPPIRTREVTPYETAEHPIVPLWPSGAPGFESRKDEPEKVLNNRQVNIHNPTLTLYLPPKSSAPKETPPLFLAAGGDDRLSEPLATFYVACRKASVGAEMHIFAGIGHGFGLQEKIKPMFARGLTVFAIGSLTANLSVARRPDRLLTRAVLNMRARDKTDFLPSEPAAARASCSYPTGQVEESEVSGQNVCGVRWRRRSVSARL